MLINCNGILLNLTSPKVMGIINVTPDSFYDGGIYKNIYDIMNKVNLYIEEGVDILDIGGYSTRPGSKIISEQEEINRVIPVIKEIRKYYKNIVISIDTFRSSIAEEAIRNGANIINDISGMSFDSNMLDVLSNYKIPYILTHIKGNIYNYHDSFSYKNIILEINKYFSEKIDILSTKGINDVIIDPGFGFSKNIEQNFSLLKKIDYLSILDRPILIGISRKSMIYNTLKISPSESLNITSVLNFYALFKGVNILRVHDIKQAKHVIKIFKLLK